MGEYKMIKIQLTVDQFNRINKFGKKYNGIKDSARENLKYTRLVIQGNKLTAEGLDGYKVFRMNLDIENLSGKDGYIYIETMKNFKKSDEFVIITEDEKEIRIESIKGDDIRIINKADFEFFNTKDIIKRDEPTFKISFDPKRLRDALDAYDDKAITLEFFGVYEQVKITNNLDTESILLPVRPRD